MEWLSANMGTIVVSLILIAIVIWDIRKIISDRKKGVKSCGMNCPGCTGSCSNVEVPERFRAKKFEDKKFGEKKVNKS
jgi:heterodisulfide reductase subunit C